MRFLIHFVGDIHQPLHSTSRVDNEYPAGDRGGNSVPLPSKDGAKNLHAVWDAVIYSEAGDYNTPLSANDWTSLSNEAKKLMKMYPIDSKTANEIDPKVWANDSFKISQEIVYKGIHENEKLSDDYIKKAEELAQKQVVIGGYRLASMIKSLKLDNWGVREESAAETEIKFLGIF